MKLHSLKDFVLFKEFSHLTPFSEPGNNTAVCPETVFSTRIFSVENSVLPVEAFGIVTWSVSFHVNKQFKMIKLK